MSGKSTFLRTIALNIVFAQSIGFCAASRFSCSPFSVATLILKSDTVTGGESIYYYEARRIQAMLREAVSGTPSFFAVDEFFSGTNTTERVAAAVSVLTYLADTGCLTLAATHDVQIASRLGTEYRLLYFADRIEDGEIRFDYTLRQGIINSTNALRMLKHIGYPEEVVSQAMREIEGPPAADESPGLEEPPMEETS
jgi:DNA mismatch repair ATPase MutS